MRRAVIRAMRKRIIRRTVVATLAAVALLLSVVSLTVTLCVWPRQQAPDTVEPATSQDTIPVLTPESDLWLRNKSLTEAIEQAAGVKFVKNEAGEVNINLEENRAIVDAITELDLFEKKLYSLEGIEIFTSLQFLNCANNYLTTLDLSANHELTTLDCYNNNLTMLDLSGNRELTILSCSGNSLTSLDLTQCPFLIKLNCFDNQLSNLDLSANRQLRFIRCTSNYLAALDLTSAPDAIRIFCGYQKDAVLKTASLRLILTLRESQRSAWEKISLPDINVGVIFLPDGTVRR